MLDVSGNAIGDIGFEHLCRGLQRCASLHTLLAGRTALSASCPLDALVGVLRECGELHTLSLRCNAVRVRPLGPSLARCRALQELDLWGVLDGSSVLPSVLAMPRLRRLTLSLRRQQQEQEQEQLVQLLQCNGVLQLEVQWVGSCI